MAREVRDPGERERFLGLVESEVARLDRLLRGAREISSIDARLDGEERAPVELSALLGSIVEGFRARLGSAGPQLLLAIADQAPVFVSVDRLTQVVENLLDNAVSFSPAGGTVTVTLAVTAGRAVVRVSDEGPGFPEAHLERVFSRFFSYRPHQHDAVEHSGLGLAIVKAIVEGYGGAVVARNRVPVGAELEVTLPLAPQAAALNRRA
jgi:two-component system, OmpR family, sensor histidine kinase ChvG